MIIEVLSLLLIISLGVITSIKDIKTGIIPNKLLLGYLIIGLLFDGIYYGIFCKDLIIPFLFNIAAIWIIALILFFTNSIAGGDCKMLIVMSLLYPANYYLTYLGSRLTLFLSIGFSIFICYLFVLGSSAWKLLIGDNKLNSKVIKSYLLSYFKSYFVALIYVVFSVLIFKLLSEYVVNINSIIIIIASIIIAWVSGRLTYLKKKTIYIPVLLADIALSVFLRVIPLSTTPKSYLFTAILVICQMTIKTNIYETIPTASVKKGMILSTYSSYIMQNSRVQGLPSVSKESLTDRITQEQSESIKRWGKTSKGQLSISIVKKIPFAIFISLGFFTYFVIWVMVK